MSNPDTLDAIRRTVADYERFQTEPARFLPLHTRDAIVVNVVGRRVLGRDELSEAMTAAMATPLAHFVSKIEIDDIRFARPDVAIVSATKHASDQRAGMPAEPSDVDRYADLTAIMTMVLVQDDGGWRVAACQSSLLDAA